MIKHFLGSLGVMAAIALGLAVSVNAAPTHTRSHNPNLLRDSVTTTAPCSVTLGQKAKVASAGAKSPSVTFLPNCGGTTVVNPVREVVTRTERVTIAQAAGGGGKVQVDAPAGGAKTGGGVAATGGLIALGSLGSIGFGVTRLLKFGA